MRYKNNNLNNSVKQFGQVIIIINLIAVAKFFETTCTAIFKYLLNTESQKNCLSRLVSTYFGMVKINAQWMLHLYCLV